MKTAAKLEIDNSSPFRLSFPFRAGSGAIHRAPQGSVRGSQLASADCSAQFHQHPSTPTLRKPRHKRIFALGDRLLRRNSALFLSLWHDSLATQIPYHSISIRRGRSLTGDNGRRISRARVVVLIQLPIGSLDDWTLSANPIPAAEKTRGSKSVRIATRGLAAQDNTYLPSIFVRAVLQSNPLSNAPTPRPSSTS